jgi:BirA family biotin operon repressor/biotin-[acetyl-CoA-carboxylase] ligase
LLGTLHHHFSSVDSTLTKAWELVQAGEPTPFWLTADEQTQGRGRMARPWVSVPGNLYSTYVGPPPSPAVASLLPFAVSLAVYDAISEALPATRRGALALKWPNDVLIDDAKTSGILVEQRSSSNGQMVMAIGIGINVEHAPQIDGRKTTHLHGEGASASVGQLLASLRTSLGVWLSALENNTARVLPSWSQRAVGLGQPITVRMAEDVLEGTFDHLAPDGSLVLRQNSGAMVTIRTGDIFLRPR